MYWFCACQLAAGYISRHLQREQTASQAAIGAREYEGRASAKSAASRVCVRCTL